MNVATQVLAVRLILLMSVLGSVALAMMALAQHDMLQLAVLGVYTATVVIPLVWLSSRH